MTKQVNPDLQGAIDQRLIEALSSANYRITLNLQKQNVILKFKRGLTFSINGGTFIVSSELISFVSVLLTHGKSDAILIDINDNPIDIENLKDFLDNIINIYYECVNEYYTEIKAIKKARNPKALVGEQ